MPTDPNIILSGNRPTVELQDPTLIRARVQSLRDMIQQRQIRDEQLQNVQFERKQAQDLADRQARFRAEISANPNAPFARLAGIDPKSAVDHAKGLHEIQKVENEAKEAQRKQYLAGLDISARELGSLLPLTPEQKIQAYPAVVQRLIEAKVLQPGQAPQQYPGDDFINAQVRKALSAKEQFAVKIDEERNARETAEHTAKLPGLEADSLIKKIQAGHWQELGMSKEDAETLKRLKDHDAAQQAHWKAMEATAKTTAGAAAKNAEANMIRAKVARDQNDGALELSPEGLKTAAILFAKTGQMVPMGAGPAARKQRAAIVNKAAELYPTLDVAANAAEYKANQASLKDIQGKLDAISAFKSTAKGNLQRWVESAQHVIHFGSPLINEPVRNVANKVFGSKDQAVYEGARLVAVTEVSRVLNQPNLSGVLSDHARDESSKVAPANMSLKQLYGVSKLILADMNQREGDLTNMRNAIEARLRNAPQDGASGGNNNTGTGKDNRPPLGEFWKNAGPQ